MQFGVESVLALAVGLVLGAGLARFDIWRKNRK